MGEVLVLVKLNEKTQCDEPHSFIPLMHDKHDEGFFSPFLIFFSPQTKSNQSNKKADHTECSELKRTHKDP